MFIDVWDRVSLCGPCWPGTYYVDQGDPEPTETCWPLPQSAYIKNICHHAWYGLYLKCSLEACVLEGWESWCPWQTSALSFSFYTHTECKSFRVVKAPSRVQSLGRQVTCSSRFGLHAGCPSEGDIQTMSVKSENWWEPRKGDIPRTRISAEGNLRLSEWALERTLRRYRELSLWEELSKPSGNSYSTTVCLGGGGTEYQTVRALHWLWSRFSLASPSLLWDWKCTFCPSSHAQSMKWVSLRGVYTSGSQEILEMDFWQRILEILWRGMTYVLCLEMDMWYWGTRGQRGRMF